MYNVVQVYRIACYPIFITGIENIVNPQFCCTVTVLQSAELLYCDGTAELLYFDGTAELEL